MSAPDHQTRDAMVFQLVAALEEYEADVTQLCRSWLDMEQYQWVSQQIDELRLYSADLPKLSVPWVSVLISHSELIHSLWKARRPHADDQAPIEDVLAEHLAAVRALGRAARQLVTRQ
jgi:hypothetical protein